MARLSVLGAGDILPQKHLPAHLDPTTMSAQSAADRARGNHTGTQVAATISDLVEVVQDIIASTVVAGTNVTVSYNDASGLFTISSSGGGGGTVTPATTTTYGTIILAGDLAGTPDAPTVPNKAPLIHTHAASDVVSGIFAIATAPVGSTFHIIKALGMYGASAGSWPSVRPSTRTDIVFIWQGNTDPGNLTYANDSWKVVP